MKRMAQSSARQTGFIRNPVLVFALLVITVSVIVVTGWYFSFVSFPFENRPPASQLFINGTVLTMDAKNTVAEALAIEGERIIAVGSNREILQYKKNDTLVHDLKGASLLPGFIDAHGHFPGWADNSLIVDLNSPPIGNIASIEQALTKLRQAVKNKAAGQWLLAYGYDDTMLAEQRHINRWDLDQVSSEHPIYVLHISGHIVAANSLALQLVGIDESSLNPPGGVIRRDKSGQLTGVLEETARLGITEMALDFSIAQFVGLLKAGAANYARSGVTTVQSGLAPEKFLLGLALASRLGLVAQRLEVWPDQDLGLRWANGEFNPQLYNSERFHIGAVKLVADGSIQGYTAYLTHPYHKPYEGDSAYRGYPTMDQQTLNHTVSRLHRAGLQVAIHANGDEAIESVIKAVSTAQQTSARSDARHIVVHGQMARKEQLLRMKEVGLTPSFFSAHVYYWGDRHRDIFLGPERAAQISPARSAAQLGLPFTLHLDAPVVPMDPLLLLSATVNRESSSGQVIGAEQRIDMMQALRAITITAAWQIFQEDNRGSIEPGKFADLVVLSGNPIEATKNVRNSEVIKTLVGGVVIYSRME